VKGEREKGKGKERGDCVMAVRGMDAPV